MLIIKGHISKLVLQHDASRIIQCATKFGSNAQRKVILQELEPILVEMTNSKYSRFVVSKLIKSCPVKEYNSRKIIIKAFKGNVYKIAFHRFGSQVLDDLWKTFPSKETSVLKEEFYSRQFTLLLLNNEKQQEEEEENNSKDNNKKKTKLEIILNQYPEKKQKILQQQYELL